MCYLTKSKQSFNFYMYMIVSIEIKNVDIDRLKVWLTSNYDFFGATKVDSMHFQSYQFNVPFGEI